MTIAFLEIQRLLPELKGMEYIALMVDVLEYVEQRFAPVKKYFPKEEGKK